MNKVLNTNTKQITRKNKMSKWNLMNERQAYLMIMPALIGFFVFSIYPILWNVRYAFFDYDGINATFIGLDNFIRAFTRDLSFWKSIGNTFIIAYGKLIIEIPLALIIALMLSNKLIKYKKIYSLGFYLPNVTGVAVNCLIFSFLFATFNGPVNNGLMEIGIIDEAINWFGAKWTALFVIMLESLWAGLATNILYFMAGVQNIPEDSIEAAQIDGANKIQIFFKITLPMLAPVMRVILMLAMINGMKIMNAVLLLTNGGPGNSTNVVMLQIYKMFFNPETTPQYGYASALGIITSVIIGILTFIYLKLSKEKDA